MNRIIETPYGLSSYVLQIRLLIISRHAKQQEKMIVFLFYNHENPASEHSYQISYERLPTKQNKKRTERKNYKTLNIMKL